MNSKLKSSKKQPIKKQADNTNSAHNIDNTDKIDSINCIHIKGAREHNLKDIDLTIPKNKLIVFTGVSGSGKSSLAFNTLYAEGQRRYIESLSSYVRQFLDKINKPDVDKIDGLTPAIAIDQKTTSKNPRSTVGTITEIYDYLRILYARIGTQTCHKCGKEISHMTKDDIIKEVLKLPINSKLSILAPIVKDKKGSFSDKLEILRQRGFVRAQINGKIMRLDEDIELNKTKKHTIKAIIDRVVLNEDSTTRIAQDIERALEESFGEVEIEFEHEGQADLLHYSLHFACFDCKISFDPLEPLSFSFNSPKGACPDCNGLGSKYTIDVKKLIDQSLPLNRGGIKAIYGFNRGYYSYLFEAFCKSQKISLNSTFDELTPMQQSSILHGSSDEFQIIWKGQQVTRNFRGILQIAYDLFKDERDFSDYMSEKICQTCKGMRLKPESLSVKIGNLGIGDLINMPIKDTYAFFTNENNFANLTDQQIFIAQNVFKEIKERLFFLNDVGLGYLSLGRDARSISGGESQRIRIAGQIGSGLTGVMYVLDEPSIGLHERDTLRLINTLKSLRDRGNTLIVVEHDRETIKNADYIVDIGPLAGIHGGSVEFFGTPKELLSSNTQTALYLSRKKDINYRAYRQQKHFLHINNVNINNLKSISAKIPLQNFVCITGVSGSGKSSLILQTLLPITQKLLNNAKRFNQSQGVEVLGLEHLDKVIYLDQSPIGRTPRSNPATYTGVMNDIRSVFSEIKEAKMLGYGIGRFSFNVKGGRCEKCQGEGEIKIEMHFLPDVMVKCDQCKGARYNPQTLAIKYRGKNIAQVLEMSVSEALEFFTKHPKINRILQTLEDVGLGYITIGQNAITLSGGEAQRVKLASELCKKQTGKTLYILDEPTTGLHFLDVDRLVQMLHKLVELGNSVIVIEHNLDLIKNADYIIDMGPEGGDLGGQIIAQGNPEEIAKNYKNSYTAEYLAKELKSLKKI